MSAGAFEERVLTWLSTAKIEPTAEERRQLEWVYERIVHRLLGELDEAERGELEALAQATPPEERDAVSRRLAAALGPRIAEMLGPREATSTAPRRTVDLASPRGDGDRRARLLTLRARVIAKRKGG